MIDEKGLTLKVAGFIVIPAQIIALLTLVLGSMPAIFWVTLAVGAGIVTVESLPDEWC